MIEREELIKEYEENTEKAKEGFPILFSAKSEYKFSSELSESLYGNRLNRRIIEDWNKYSVGLDLFCCENVIVKPKELKLIRLGLIVKPSDGYFFEIVPRSSTFKNFGLIQANSIGIIDPSYCGDNDELMWAAYNPGDVEKQLAIGDRPCQLILRQAIVIDFSKMETGRDGSRGGFGTTGKNINDLEMGS